jgi:hypothetical protein
MDDNLDGKPLPAYRHPHWIDEDPTPLPTLYDEDGYPVIDFAPVPMLRRRRGGWDEMKQRLFIALLARVPSVVRAARACGMSARSAYKLLDKPGAEQFAKAWDDAIDHGLNRLRCGALERAIDGGDFVPIYRKGRLVRIEHRRNDKLAIALLSGRKDVDAYRRTSQNRWRQRQEWAALDAERAAKIEQEARFREDYARELEEMVRRGRKRKAIPRVLML